MPKRIKMYHLPKDIINLIYEFDADHREKFKEVLKRIPLILSFDSIQHVAVRIRSLNLVKKYDDQVFETGNCDFEKVIRENIDDVNRLLTVYSRCTCCSYHVEQKKCIKVTNEAKSRYYRPIRYFNQFNDCTCNCHTMTSFMSKMQTNKFTFKDRYSTKWHNFHLMSESESDDESDDDFDMSDSFS